MKCSKHPRVDAVGVCLSCGIGVCRDCEIKVLGRTHCKQCVETGKATSATSPTGERVTPAKALKVSPSRTYFILGAIGFILLLVAAPLLMAANIIMNFFHYLICPGHIAYYIMNTLAYVLLIVGGVLGSFTFYGCRRNYGSLMGEAIFIISIVFVWFLLAKVEFNASSIFGPPPYVSIVLSFLSIILFGVMMILWGATFIVVRNHMGNVGLGVATGILLIISGAFWCIPTGLMITYGGPYISLFICALMIPAAILGLITLLRARVPS